MSLSPAEVVRVHTRNARSLSQPRDSDGAFPSPPHLGDFFLSFSFSFFFFYLGLFFLMEVRGLLMRFDANQPGWKAPAEGIDLQFIEMSTEGRWQTGDNLQFILPRDAFNEMQCTSLAYCY